jgi:hypothetical protein
MSSIKFGNRIMIEVPLGISWQYKYMIIDTSLLATKPSLVKGLDALIGQLTGIKYYYGDLEEKATLERVQEFKKETHLAYVMSPAYEPKFDFSSTLLSDSLLADSSATKGATKRDTFVFDQSTNKVSFKEHNSTE